MTLDEDFGVLRPPARVLEWEKGCEPRSKSVANMDNCKSLSDLIAIVQCPLFRFAAQAKNYIWAVDEFGDIIISVEELALADEQGPYLGYPRRRFSCHPAEDRKLGHPTLVGEGKARIAGELAFDEKADGSLHWVLNANSGRYCALKPPSNAQLQNVANSLREFGLEVYVDFEI